jgi:hypothetical protein
MPLDVMNAGFPSYQLGKQILDSLESGRLALSLEDPELNKWVPGLARAKGQGLREFLMSIVHATDGAVAAYEAGYRDEPVPEACDTLTGLCAYVALLLRDTIMARILSGELSGYEGQLALAVLRRFDDNPQSLSNAAWFAAKMGERHQ